MSWKQTKPNNNIDASQYLKGQGSNKMQSVPMYTMDYNNKVEEQSEYDDANNITQALLSHQVPRQPQSYASSSYNSASYDAPDIYQVTPMQAVKVRSELQLNVLKEGGARFFAEGAGKPYKDRELEKQARIRNAADEVKKRVHDVVHSESMLKTRRSGIVPKDIFWVDDPTVHFQCTVKLNDIAKGKFVEMDLFKDKNSVKKFFKFDQKGIIGDNISNAILVEAVMKYCANNIPVRVGMRLVHKRGKDTKEFDCMDHQERETGDMYHAVFAPMAKLQSVLTAYKNSESVDDDYYMLYPELIADEKMLEVDIIDGGVDRHIPVGHPVAKFMFENAHIYQHWIDALPDKQSSAKEGYYTISTLLYNDIKDKLLIYVGTNFPVVDLSSIAVRFYFLENMSASASEMNDIDKFNKILPSSYTIDGSLQIVYALRNIKKAKS